MREFGTLKGLWSRELSEIKGIEPIIDYFQRELANLKDDKKSREVLQRYEMQIYRAQQSFQHFRDWDVAYKYATKCIKNIYDWLGDKYDVLVANRDWKPEASFLGLLADNLEEKDEVIMDIGCGTGIDLNALATLFPQKQFIGFDVSTGQIQAAFSRTKKYNHKNVQLFIAEQQNMPLKSESVNVIYEKRTFGEEEILPQLMGRLDRREAPYLLKIRLADIRRVLKNDGAFITMQYLESPAGSRLPSFDYKGSVVWSETPSYSGKPFYMAYFYRKSN